MLVAIICKQNITLLLYIIKSLLYFILSFFSMFIQFLYVLTSSCSWAISTLAALDSKARSPYSQPPEEWSRICSPGNSGWWVHQMVEYFYHLLWGNPVKPGHGWFIMLHHASVWLRWLGLGIGRTCRLLPIIHHSVHATQILTAGSWRQKRILESRRQHL